MTLSQKPPKGTLDWTPEEYAIRAYIFDTWRHVCKGYGYEEYLTPIVEYADVYRAKSGEDIGGKELVTFEDRGGRELCIRPEMTPSVTRMVSGMYGSAQKPLRLFSIANFMRNERPQRGRNREFWQLNVDLFGSDILMSDIEILEIAMEMMLAFAPPKDAFKLHLNHRGVIDAVFADVDIEGEQKVLVARILDKWHKLSEENLKDELQKLDVKDTAYEKLNAFMTCTSAEELLAIFPSMKEESAFAELQQIIATLDARGYGAYVVFKPDIIRGFDYYDGMIFEIFDMHEENNRALFGGGRYNGLAELFGAQQFPAVGFAPGDETMKIFLESWGLLDHVQKAKKDKYYIPLLDEKSVDYISHVARNVRMNAGPTVQGLEVQNMGKAFQYAEKRGFTHMVIAGSDEMQEEKFIIKDLGSGTQQEHFLG